MCNPIMPLDAILAIEALVENSKLPFNKWNIGWSD